MEVSIILVVIYIMVMVCRMNKRKHTLVENENIFFGHSSEISNINVLTICDVEIAYPLF